MEEEITEEFKEELKAMRRGLIRTRRVAPQNKEEEAWWVEFHHLPYRGVEDLFNNNTDGYYLKG